MGDCPGGAESSGAFFFLLGERANRLLCRRSEKTAPVLIGGAHIHEMYSKPLVRKGLRLASCTKRSQTLGRVRMRGVFM